MSVSASSIVLIVEDEPLLRIAAISMIEDFGYEVLEAQDADAAIMILEANPQINIVFTDVQMAGSMDGLALAHVARNRWPPIRLIIVSGGTTPTLEEMPVDAIFLPKPYTSSAVRHAMKNFERA